MGDCMSVRHFINTQLVKTDVELDSDLKIPGCGPELNRLDYITGVIIKRGSRLKVQMATV